MYKDIEVDIDIDELKSFICGVESLLEVAKTQPILRQEAQTLQVYCNEFSKAITEAENEPS
jgi:hypothetical protein